MAVEQEDTWKLLHDSLSKELTDEWATLSTELVMVSKKLTIVFLLNKTTATSRIRTVLDLNSKESERIIDSGSTELGFTAASWISDGIDIEKLQTKLYKDVQSMGDKMTEHQRLDIHKRRVALMPRIQSHRQSAASFIDLHPNKMGSLPSIAEETRGQPEIASLYLPSHQQKRVSLTERSNKTTELEQIKSQMLIGKLDNVRGEVANTRAQTSLNRLEQRIKNATSDYNSSFEALKNLGVATTNLGPLKRILDAHFKGLMSILRGVRELDEGRKKLPWFWTVRESGTNGGVKEDEEEFNESIRVEWFRGRERYRRWREEELWLRRELASTLYSFQHMQESWKDLSTNDCAKANPGYRSYCIRQSDMYQGLLHCAKANPGYRSYCIRQSDMYQGLLRSGFRRGVSFLQDRPDIKICARAFKDFKSLIE
ncbi:hypothetical protein RSAG8_07195, partial [Rhizoctonia solani AG-8 WAC10335]